ncbi:MAG TPA: hypothetical protein VHX38_01465 [Pseudonocardiaceae bacterium]|jgi:hypothetical protein|nr:hypothetical protein [Pseudonocardiaceae bacterium]
MTAGGFAVQVTDFAAEAPKFSDAGTELTNATNKQSAALNALGAFWGTTANGPDFGKQYQQYATKVLALASGCGIALEGIGDGLQQMGKQYGITEDQITKAMQDTLGGIEGPKGKGEGAD